MKQATELYRVLFEQMGTANVTLFEGIADEMLRQREAGMYVTIATSRGHQSVDELCRKLGIRHLIDYIVACEDVHTHKPDPTPVLHLCQVMNVLPSDTTVIGDTTYDIEIGVGVLMQVVALVLVGETIHPNNSLLQGQTKWWIT